MPWPPCKNACWVQIFVLGKGHLEVRTVCCAVGPWNNNASNCRVSNRNNNDPSNRNNNIGFRLANTVFVRGYAFRDACRATANRPVLCPGLACGPSKTRKAPLPTLLGCETEGSGGYLLCFSQPPTMRPALHRPARQHTGTAGWRGTCDGGRSGGEFGAVPAFG